MFSVVITSALLLLLPLLEDYQNPEKNLHKGVPLHMQPSSALVICLTLSANDFPPFVTCPVAKRAFLLRASRECLRHLLELEAPLQGKRVPIILVEIQEQGTPTDCDWIAHLTTHLG